MQKKAHITLKLTEFDTPVVTTGQAVVSGDNLVKVNHTVVDEFNLSQLLHVTPAKMAAYLTVKPDSEITKGTVIAKKTGLITKHIIRSPAAGKIIIADKEKGIIGIKRERPEEMLTSWFSGTVESLTAEKIVFTVAGTAVAAVSGKGVPVSGKLLMLLDTSALLLPADIENCIVAVTEAHSDIVAKADALGVTAILTESLEEASYSLPYLIFRDLSVLENYRDRTVIVMGDEGQLLILEEGGKKKEAKPGKKK